MRKLILSTAVALAAMTSSAAFAAGSAEVAVNASLAPSCSIVSSSPSLTLVGTAAVPGDFTYKCNFTGSPSVSFTSANGGVKSTGTDANTADYYIYLNDNAGTAGAGSARASTIGASNPFTDITKTTAPNTNTTPSFSLALVSPLTVAGTYQDTLTISVAP